MSAKLRKIWGKRMFRYSFACVLAVFIAAAVYAASVPNTFVAYTTAKSSEINANFAYLAARVWELSTTNLYYTAGNVGIGTNAPTQKLHVDGNVRVVNGYIAGKDGAANAPSFTFDNSTSAGIYRAADNQIGFSTSNTERLRITDTGRVAVGRSIASAPLHVDAAQPAPGFYNDGIVVGGDHTGAVVQLCLAVGNDSGCINAIRQGVDWKPLILNSGGGFVGIGVHAPTKPLEMASGAHVTAGGVWTDASSREFKENIQELNIEEAMSALEKLKPLKFNYKNDKSENYVGFIAEEVPELVATNNRKGLSPMDIVAVLTKVVQRQQSQIEQQQKDIKELKELLREK